MTDPSDFDQWLTELVDDCAHPVPENHPTPLRDTDDGAIESYCDFCQHWIRHEPKMRSKGDGPRWLIE